MPRVQQIQTILLEKAYELGLVIHGDVSKSSLVVVLILRVSFATVLLTYPQSEKSNYPPGMILNDYGGSPSPVEEENVGSKKCMSTLRLNVEGIEFCYLFFLPSSFRFVLMVQFQPSVPNPSILFNQIDDSVKMWIELFSQLFKEVLNSGIEFLSYSSMCIDTQIFRMSIYHKIILTLNFLLIKYNPCCFCLRTNECLLD